MEPGAYGMRHRRSLNASVEDRLAFVLSNGTALNAEAQTTSRLPTRAFLLPVNRVAERRGFCAC